METQGDLSVIVTNKDVNENGELMLHTPIPNVSSVHCNRFRFLHTMPTFSTDMEFQFEEISGDTHYSYEPFTIPEGYYTMPGFGQDDTWNPSAGNNFLHTMKEQYNNVRGEFDRRINRLYIGSVDGKLHMVLSDLRSTTTHINLLTRVGNEWERVRHTFLGGDINAGEYDFTFSHDDTESGESEWRGGGSHTPYLPTEKALFLRLRNVENNAVVAKDQSEVGMDNIILTTLLEGVPPGWVEKPYELDETVQFQHTHNLYHLRFGLEYMSDRVNRIRSIPWTAELIFR